MAVVSESNDHSRIAAFNCIVTIVNELKKMMGELRKVILWSDGCSSQFRSKFVICTTSSNFERNIALQWNYNEAHQGKGPMDGVQGTIKLVVYGLVKSRHININTAEEFAENAPAIKGTFGVHHVKRDYNLENVCFLEFCYLSDDKEPFHTQYYPRLNTHVCDHGRKSDEVNEKICGHCQKDYDGDSEIWLQRPSCRIWFYASCFET